jgi:hypothetical protein
MLISMINWVKNVGFKIPIIKRFIPIKNDNYEISKKINQSTKINFTLESENKTLCIESIKSILEKHQRVNILDKKYPELTKKIKNLLVKISPNSPVDFKEIGLKKIIEEYQEKLNTQFENEIIHLNNQIYDPRSTIKYKELWNDYIKESKRLMLEIVDIVVLSTCNIEKVNDIDLMNSLKVSKTLTKQIAEASLRCIIANLTNIPIGYEIENQNRIENLRDNIKNDFKEENTNLYLVSKFGIFSSDLIKGIYSILEKNSISKGIELFENISIINKFQEAIQGSLLQNKEDLNSNWNDIGKVNTKIVKESFERIISLYRDYVSLRSTYINYEIYSKRKKEIIGEIKDLKHFIYSLGLTENIEFNNLIQLKNDDVLENLNISRTEATSKLFDTYKNIHQISKSLGTLQADEIMGLRFEKTPIINLFNLENEEGNDHLKRIVLEVSILAGIKVILGHMYPEKNNLDFTLVRKNANNKILPSTLNFESIPWLKSFYTERVEFFENIVKNDNSSFQIAPIIKEISNIGKELHKDKLFTASDFFERYGLYKEKDDLLNIIGEMTEIGRISLNIGFVTNFLSYLNYDEKCPITKEEVTNIKLLIRYLKEKSKVIDENGKEINAPSGKDRKLEKLYDKMKEDVSRREFLSLNTPLVTNFIKKCYGRDVSPPRKIKKESFEANNQVLASWLFYILLKFLPDKSYSNDSLDSRMEITKLVLDEEFQSDHEINPSLFKKMIKQARGMSELGNFASTRGRKGVIKALCLDLENQINGYIFENKGYIPLKNILNHYSALETTLKNNPKSHEKIMKVQREFFKTNEPLLQPLANKLIGLYKNEPDIVLAFIKNSLNNNPEYKEKFAIDLIQKIDSDIKTTQIKNPIIIKDSDEKNLKKITEIIRDINNLGYIIDERGQERVELNEKVFGQTGRAVEINQKIDNIKRFIDAKIQIIEDTSYSPQNELFENQYQTIMNLRKLLQKTNMEYKASYKKMEDKERAKNYNLAI